MILFLHNFITRNITNLFLYGVILVLLQFYSHVI